MRIWTRKTDLRGRLILPRDFADCIVVVERNGDELRVRKAKATRRRYSFKRLMAGVTKENIHTGVETGTPVGREPL